MKSRQIRKVQSVSHQRQGGELYFSKAHGHYF